MNEITRGDDEGCHYNPRDDVGDQVSLRFGRRGLRNELIDFPCAQFWTSLYRVGHSLRGVRTWVNGHTADCRVGHPVDTAS